MWYDNVELFILWSIIYGICNFLFHHKWYVIFLFDHYAGFYMEFTWMWELQGHEESKFLKNKFISVIELQCLSEADWTESALFALAYLQATRFRNSQSSNIPWVFVILTFFTQTLYLLVPSADIFCKQSGTRSGLTKCQAWSGFKLFDTQGIPERIFRKGEFWKKLSDDKELRPIPYLEILCSW